MKWLELQDSPIKGYLSHSQIFKWMTCRLAFYYRYVQKIRTALPAKVILGLAYHRAMEAAYKVKARDKWYADIGPDAFATDFDSAKTRTEINWNEPKATVRKQGLGLVKLYGKQIAPTVPITDETHIEKAMETEIAGVKVKGYVDLISDDHILVDHKTSARRKKAADLQDDLQTSIYEYGMVKEGLPIAGRAWHSAVRLKKPVVEVLAVPSAKEGFATLEKIIAGVSLDMRTGNFYPSGFPKNCGWCDYKDKGCEVWRGRVSASAPEIARIDGGGE